MAAAGAREADATKLSDEIKPPMKGHYMTEEERKARQGWTVTFGGFLTGTGKPQITLAELAKRRAPKRTRQSR